MTGAPRTLRSRLVLSFVAVALGVLVVAGGVTLAFARANAVSSAQDDLAQHAAALDPLLEELPRDRLAGLLRVLRLQAAGLVPLNRVEWAPGVLPEGLDPDDLDIDRIRAGETVTGRSGGIVFVARPVDTALPPGPLAGARRPPRDPVQDVPRQALVLTREVDPIDLGGLGPWLLTAGGVALAAAGGIGAWLAGRLIRPLTATQRAAQAIAAGDLSARVGEAGRSDRELADVAQAFDAMADELERSRHLTREFLMSVSHDLRTPLTSIRGYAEAISEGAARGKAEREKAAAVIEAEARRLERLVSDLLDLARLDARRFTLDPRPTDPGEVVASVADGLRPLAARYDVTIEVVADGWGNHARELDPERLGQVVANLMENALKYAASRVGVAAVERDGLVVIEVSDDGPGISEGDLDRVFDRLYTARPAEGRPVGTGLGLAIVHELVAAMGGDVEVEPTPEGGARFRVLLPSHPRS